LILMQVRGQELEIAWWGNPSAHLPIVMLHEGLGSVSVWKDFPALLAQSTGRRVMAYSRFGHGLSSPPSQPATTRFMHDEARLLPEVLDAASVGRAILFGHSDGGSIALIFAAAHRNRVEALILEAPHVFVESVSLASIENQVAAYHAADGKLRRRLAKHHRDPDTTFYGWSKVWLDPGFKQWNIEDCLPRITCPVLLIQGLEDQYGTLEQILAIERQVGGQTRRIVLSGCGHSPHRDAPARVLSEVTTFVQRLA
jgi:pimeloyl-ACP methyl ester carboxylesterase